MAVVTESDDPFDLSTTLVPIDRGTERERPKASRVIVTGMHRSATSAVAQLLGANGFDLGAPADLIGPEPANPHGYFEYRGINELNESLLAAAGGTWWNPPAADAIAAMSDEMARRIRPVWRQFLSTTTREVPVAKDPRFCLLLPAWRQVLGDDTLYVICVRDPVAAARSLLGRDRTDIPAGCALWEIYLVSCLRALSGATALFVDVSRLQVDEQARYALVNRVHEAVGATASTDIVDSFDRQILGPSTSPQDLLDNLSGYQLALHRSLTRLPLDVVVVDDLSHLRISAAALRITANNSAAADSQLRQQLDLERGEVARLRVALGLDNPNRDRDALLRIDPSSVRTDLATARQRIGELELSVAKSTDEALRSRAALDSARATITQLETQVAAASAEAQQNLDRWAAAEDRRQKATEELAKTHELYGAAFASKSWRWTRPMRREGRDAQGRDVARDPASQAGDPSFARPPIAVVVHMFYPDLWLPLQEQLGNLQVPYDLVVSLTEGHSEQLAESILRVFPHATIRSFPNLGRDIAPFVEFIHSGDLDGYNAILKLHSKRSQHLVDGADWRTTLWHGLLPNPHDAERFAGIVANTPDVGCIVPAGNIRAAEWIGSNAARIEELLNRVGLDFQLDELQFPAGSMYWLDGSVVEPIRAIFRPASADFEPELGQVDGTTAHAFERILGVLLTQRGQRLIESESA